MIVRELVKNHLKIWKLPGEQQTKGPNFEEALLNENLCHVKINNGGT